MDLSFFSFSKESWVTELLTLFKSNAKFCFQSNSQSWFPDSVTVFPFVSPTLETSYEELSLLLSVLVWSKTDLGGTSGDLGGRGGDK